jgi:hypothetical protein
VKAPGTLKRTTFLPAHSVVIKSAMVLALQQIESVGRGGGSVNRGVNPQRDRVGFWRGKT